MKTFIYNFICFLLGCITTAYLCFNMFILPAYFGQFSISVDTLEQLKLEPTNGRDTASNIAQVYLPRELCIVTELVDSIFVINKEVYEDDINRGFKLVDVEASAQNIYCSVPLAERTLRHPG